MKIAIAADHAGFELKEALRAHLAEKGHLVQDFGTNSKESTDYPDYASMVAREVAQGKADRGILVCATGSGMAIAANKVSGVRAALAVNEEQVKLSRTHNDANVLTFGARFTTSQMAKPLTELFLDAEFEGGRHARRLAKIAQLEQQETFKK